MIDFIKRNVCLTVAAALASNALGCGSLMYPNRRGAQGGRIDVGVAVLDAIGLLFFVIPGVIAFAVDFSDGAIYLPGGGGDGRFGLRKVRFDRSGGAGAIETAVLTQTGRAVDLSAGGVKVARLSSTAELPARFAGAASTRN